VNETPVDYAGVDKQFWTDWIDTLDETA